MEPPTYNYEPINSLDLDYKQIIINRLKQDIDFETKNKNYFYIFLFSLST